MPRVDASQPEANAELPGGMRRGAGIKLTMAMPNAMGSGTRQRSRHHQAASGVARIIGTLLKSQRWAEVVAATNVLRRGRRVRVTLSGAGGAPRRLQAVRTREGVALQFPL